VPLFSILRLLFTLLALSVLAGALWFAWEWYQGDMLRTDAGELILVRHDWYLWAALALAVWSFAGKFFWNFVLARADHDDAVPERSGGSFIEGVEGSEIYVEMTGKEDGMPIILTHGAANDSTVWYLAKKALGAKFRLITWDLPGLGRSEARRLDLDHYAASLQTVLGLVKQPVVVVGHSLGGMIIQTLALRQPQLFGTAIVGTVLLNTTYTNPLKTMIFSGLARALQPILKFAFYVEVALFPLAWLSAWQSYLSGSTHIATRLTFGAGVTRKQLDHAALLATRNSPASIARGNLAMIDWDGTGAVANIDGPLLIIAGAGDIVTKPEASKTIAASAIAPTLHVMGGGNHMSFLDHASVYHAHIDQFATAASERARALHLREGN
jgi:pimeloyl-ACP methyl ester carboxylesterase